MTRPIRFAIVAVAGLVLATPALAQTQVPAPKLNEHASDTAKARIASLPHATQVRGSAVSPPNRPVTPATPAVPSTGATPATPGKGGTPAVPAVPAVPATPAVPASPVTPPTPPPPPGQPTSPGQSGGHRP